MSNNNGSLLVSPFATVKQNPTSQKVQANHILDQFGAVIPPTNDPAYQPPTDPLENVNVKERARVINRDIPIVTTQAGWSISQVRSAVEALVTGMFDAPSMLVDSMLGDSRVHSSLASRCGGLIGRSINFKIPQKYKDSAIAKECLEVWQEHWPTMAVEPILSSMQTWSSMLGFWTGQCLWDTSGPYWKPYLQSWSTRYTYYHWNYRKYVAITLDGQVPIEPGDGHWVLHTPNGPYRGWMVGALRAIAPWWLSRNYALRDWARYSERHGMPIGKAVTPFGSDPVMVQNYRNQLAQLGQESILQLPQSAEAAIGKYDFEWIETKDQAWDGFQGLIAQCNAEITLALLGQNLTSEVKEGSFAAARIHADVRQAILEHDARALSQTIYRQIARPFAALNFGDPDLAPRTEWDVAPYEDNEAASRTLKTFCEALVSFKAAGFVVRNIEEFARQFGLFLKRADVEQVETKLEEPEDEISA